MKSKLRSKSQDFDPKTTFFYYPYVMLRKEERKIANNPFLILQSSVYPANRVVACGIFEKKGENYELFIGITMCSNKDNFVKKVGRAKALGRAKQIREHLREGKPSHGLLPIPAILVTPEHLKTATLGKIFLNQVKTAITLSLGSIIDKEDLEVDYEQHARRLKLLKQREIEKANQKALANTENPYSY